MYMSGKQMYIVCINVRRWALKVLGPLEGPGPSGAPWAPCGPGHNGP